MNDPRYAVLEALHRESSSNREILAESTECGCFYCKRIYDPIEIVEWSGGSNGIGNETAVCPYCRKDAVIGNDTIDICAEMLNDMHDHYYSTCSVKFEAEEEQSLDEYAKIFFPFHEWEKGTCDNYQKKMRSRVITNPGEEAGEYIENQKLGLSPFESPAESLPLVACGLDGQNSQVKSAENLQQELENFVLITEVCNGETALDQQTAEAFSASAWAMLLKSKPEYVNICDTGRMSTADLMSILIQAPKAAINLDTSRLTRKEWIQLVKCQPKLRPLAVKLLADQTC